MPVFDRLLRTLALAGGAVLFLLMGYTVLDVVLRYVFNAPFSSSLELTEFAMALIVFLGIAYCGWTGGHVAVDILERPLKSPALRLVPVVLSVIGAALFATIAYLTAMEAFASAHRVTNMIRWPYYPFQLVAAFGAAMYALVLVVQSVQSFRQKR